MFCSGLKDSGFDGIAASCIFAREEPDENPLRTMRQEIGEYTAWDLY